MSQVALEINGKWQSINQIGLYVEKVILTSYPIPYRKVNSRLIKEKL